jgi:hypothetical protein
MRWLTAATILEYARVIFNDVQLDLRPIVDYVEFERGHFIADHCRSSASFDQSPCSALAPHDRNRTLAALTVDRKLPKVRVAFTSSSPASCRSLIVFRTPPSRFDPQDQLSSVLAAQLDPSASFSLNGFPEGSPRNRRKPFPRAHRPGKFPVTKGESTFICTLGS